MGTSTVKEGLDRRERVVVVVGSISASISRRKSDETLKQRADEPTNPIFMETKAKDEASSPSRIEGGPGVGRASTRAVPGLGELRRPLTRLDIRDTTPMTMMTPVRWTNDVSSIDKDDATGPPALPVGTSTVGGPPGEGRGRRGKQRVGGRRQNSDESSHFRRRTISRPTMTKTDDNGPINSIMDASHWGGTGIGML